MYCTDFEKIGKIMKLSNKTFCIIALKIHHNDFIFSVVNFLPKGKRKSFLQNNEELYWKKVYKTFRK